MLWSYIQPLTQFLMYVFIFALLMGRGDTIRTSPSTSSQR
jgi:ABC-type polysaccharide/polyol phosphate export permease